MYASLIRLPPESHWASASSRIGASQACPCHSGLPAAYAAIPALPFGGGGESGIGRIHGAAGLLGFTRPHSIARQKFVIPGMALLSFGRTESTMSLVRKLTARGFVYDRPATGRLVERLKADRPPLMWMGQHISILRKAGPGFPRRKELPFGTRLT